MISLEQVLIIHKLLIEEFGGNPEVRDLEILRSCLERPFQTFDGNELYPTVETKAASIIQSIIVNHPFLDGNKRMGYVLMRLFVLNSEMDIIASQEDKYEFVISIAKGDLDYDDILAWIETRTFNI